ncbi:MAG TPA: hypothetical protein VEP90_12235 [Methylomirabilota bacterium]|nr:hypothetical protein [Methylomirabilota bacterium]
MKRQSRLIIFVLIVLSVLLTIALGLLGSAIELPSALKPIAFPLFLCVAFILCLIAVYQYFVEKRIEQTVSPFSGQNRQRLIAKVRAFWITGFLEQSLHGAALMALKEENMQVFSKLIEKLNWLKVNGFFLGIKTPEWWRAYAIPLIVRYVEHSTETHVQNTSYPPYGHWVTSCKVTWEVVLEKEIFVPGFRFETYIPFVPYKGQFKNDHAFTAYFDPAYIQAFKAYWVDLESEPRFRKTLWQIFKS